LTQTTSHRTTADAADGDVVGAEEEGATADAAEVVADRAQGKVTAKAATRPSPRKSGLIILGTE